MDKKVFASGGIIPAGTLGRAGDGVDGKEAIFPIKVSLKKLVDQLVSEMGDAENLDGILNRVKTTVVDSYIKTQKQKHAASVTPGSFEFTVNIERKPTDREIEMLRFVQGNPEVRIFKDSFPEERSPSPGVMGGSDDFGFRWLMNINAITFKDYGECMSLTKVGESILRAIDQNASTMQGDHKTEISATEDKPHD